MLQNMGKYFMRGFRKIPGVYRVLYFSLLFILLLSACEYKFPENTQVYEADNLNLNSFVVAGDDFMAGFMDGALYDDGQQHSVASVIAERLQKTGLESFHQGEIGSVNGYNVYASDPGHVYGKYIYKYPDDQAKDPVIIPTQGEEVQPYPGDKRFLNDFSVPFLRMWQIDDSSLDTNIYYHRIADDPGVSTWLSQLDQAQPTFFLLWAGMSDILGYAASGGIGDSLPADPGHMSDHDLTPAGVFSEKLDVLLTTLLKQPDSKGVLLSLPDFADLPYFYFFPYDFIKLPGSMYSLATSTYRDFNKAVTLNNQDPSKPKRPYISFNDNGATPYPQPVVVVDESLPDAQYPDGRPLEKVRQLHENELVLMGFPQDMLQYGLGSVIPLPEKYYLDEARIRTLHKRTEDFNAILLQKSLEHPGRLIYVDISESIHEIAETGKLNGWGRPPVNEVFAFEGVPLQGRLELYSIFSLDALHFNQRGNAYIARKVIDKINRAFQCKIPQVDVNAFKGNVPLY